MCLPYVNLEAVGPGTGAEGMSVGGKVLSHFC
jgi:hypothetical protein